MKHLRAGLEVAVVVALLVALGATRCAGVREGKREAEIGRLKSVIRTSQDSVTALLPKVNYADSIVKDKAVSLTKAKVIYRDKRAAVLKAPDNKPLPVVPNDRLGLMDTVAVRLAFDAADSLFEAQDSLISALNTGIAIRDAVIDAQTAQISALNRSLKLTVKQKPSRYSRIANAGKWALAGAAIATVARR